MSKWSLEEALKPKSLTQNTVDLQGRGIGDVGAEQLARALKSDWPVQVESVHAGANEITDAGAKAIAEALKVNKALTSIGLANNCISKTGHSALEAAFSANTNLKSIWLSVGSQFLPMVRDGAEAQQFID
jgi:Ran GTPase-activating protein (RanGAP) involved in mRNA processing and transport